MLKVRECAISPNTAYIFIKKQTQKVLKSLANLNDAIEANLFVNFIFVFLIKVLINKFCLLDMRILSRYTGIWERGRCSANFRHQNVQRGMAEQIVAGVVVESSGPTIPSLFRIGEVSIDLCLITDGLRHFQ